jgi:hypothetical protein
LRQELLRSPSPAGVAGAFPLNRKAILRDGTGERLDKKFSHFFCANEKQRLTLNSLVYYDNFSYFCKKTAIV